MSLQASAWYCSPILLLCFSRSEWGRCRLRRRRLRISDSLQYAARDRFISSYDVFPAFCSACQRNLSEEAIFWRKLCWPCKIGLDLFGCTYATNIILSFLTMATDIKVENIWMQIRHKHNFVIFNDGNRQLQGTNNFLVHQNFFWFTSHSCGSWVVKWMI